MANNPIISIDIDGNWIDIPNNKYRAQTLNDLAKIYATPWGKELIDDLMQSKTNFTIDGSSWHVFGNNFAVSNRDINYIPEDLDKDGIVSPSYVLLAHELFHAHSLNERGFVGHVIKQTRRQGESRAVRFGNYIRQIYSQGTRTHYGDLGRVFNESNRNLRDGKLRLNPDEITVSVDTKLGDGSLSPYRTNSRIDHFEVLYYGKVISSSDNSQRGKKKHCVHCKPRKDKPKNNND